MTQAPKSRLSDALADRYRIERELGQGGMATVYLAEDLKHQRKVAIKVLKPELAAVLGADRFVQEITTTAALQHPHILPLFDSGTVEGFLYYVMPFIDGETLRQKLDRETQLGVDEAVRITTEVADALDYAHRHGVIHRDIKPENILLHDGRPMVADFGIALAVSAAAGGRMTETGLSLGTPHYMSPEQATAEKEITARSDVYSLGAVLYEMLTGNPPHTGASAQQIIMRIVTEEPTPVTSVRKAVPPNVAVAVGIALEKLPADRFEGASAFAAALHNPAFANAVAGRTTAAEAPHGRSQALLRTLAATTILATGVALWGWLRPQPPAPLRQYSMFIPPDQAVSSAAPVLGDRLALSPDGSKLVYVGGDQATGGVGLWIRDRERLEAVPIAGTAAARRPFFKPDGSWIGYFGADGSIRVIGVEGGAPRTVSSDPVYATGGGSWGADGYIYAGAGATGRDGILRIPEDGGTPERVTTMDTARGDLLHLYPRVLPGGRGVLFVIRGGGSDRIAAVDLRTGRLHDLTAGVSAWYAASGHLLYLLDDGNLMAAPFDEAALEITGPARTVFAGIGMTRLGADVTLSASGTLMFLSGTAGFGVEPVWVDGSGTATPVDPAWTFASTSLYSTLELSPDESRLVVSQGTSSGQQLWVKQLPQGPNMQLTFDGRVNSRAKWSPDGRSVLFVSDRSGRNQVWRRVADGSAPVELVSPEFANEGFFTRDGEWFIYRGMAGDRHIYARRLQGDTATLVVARSERGEDLAPNLSPNGKWIAYVSTESGRNEVYLRPFPDVNRSKALVSTAGGAEPRWSRDGRALFYRSEADELVRMPVESREDSLSLGVPQVLFSTRDFLPLNPFQATYDVARDGRFVMGRRLAAVEGMEPEQLIVVENFVNHLERLMRQ